MRGRNRDRNNYRPIQSLKAHYAMEEMNLGPDTTLK